MAKTVATAKSFSWGADAGQDQIKPSLRIQELRKRYLEWKPRVGYELALYWTQAFKESEGEPPIIRRAKVMKKYFENKSLHIAPGELIVGGTDRQPLSTANLPDMNVMWIENELDLLSKRDYDPMEVEQETKRIFREEIFPYWRGRTFEEIWLKRAEIVAPEALRLGYNTCISDQGVVIFFDINHHLPSFTRVLEKGFLGIRKEVEEKLSALNLADPESTEKVVFFKALMIACDGAAMIGKRYAAKARELAGKEKNPQTKAGYLKVAEICDRVPAEPARTFHEAVQAAYFTHFMSLNDAACVGWGRIDQWLYPWYEKDIEQGKITEEEAQDILDCLFIKCNEIQQLFSTEQARYTAGARGANACCVGGVDESGFDATNELSYMFIQAQCNVRLGHPSVMLLWHPGTPDDLTIKACQLASLGTGHPSIFNMQLLVNLLQDNGLPLKEARKGSLMGCVEPNPENGKGQANSNFGYINLGPIIEFALNQGIWRLNNELMGYPTADPHTFTSFDHVMAAFAKW